MAKKELNLYFFHISAAVFVCKLLFAVCGTVAAAGVDDDYDVIFIFSKLFLLFYFFIIVIILFISHYANEFVIFLLLFYLSSVFLQNVNKSVSLNLFLCDLKTILK